MKNSNNDPIQSDPVLEAQVADRAKAQQVSEALVKQPNDLPVITEVKGRDGKEKLVARVKGRFSSKANARVLAVQKSIEKLMHTLDDEGQTQLERIISAQAKVCEENDSAKNLGGIAKFLEHVDEISGTKDARKALTKESNTPVIPTVIINVPVLMHPEPVDWEKKQREEAERKRKGPSFAEVLDFKTNPRV